MPVLTANQHRVTLFKKSMVMFTFRYAVAVLVLGMLSQAPVANASPPVGAAYHPLSPTPEPPFPNPLKGLIPFYDAEPVAFPHSMEWVYCRLSDVVVGRDGSGNNVHDWRKFDAVLDAVARRGHQACVRFYGYYPDDERGENALPTFLHPKTYVWTEGTKKHSVPDFNDPQVVRCLTQFVAALGARYDHPTPNSRIGFLTAGLLGFWGEWHVYTGQANWDESALLNEATKGKIAKAFQDNFDNIPVLLRYPLSAAEQKQGAQRTRFGYHDDSFVFATVGSEDWYFANRMQRAKLLSPGTEIWRTHPIGGEIYPETQDDTFRSGSASYARWNASVDATHPTWMIAARVLEKNPSPSARDYVNAHKATARLGYNIRATGAYFPANAVQGSSFYVGVPLANSGVAPFYYSWKMQIGLRDKRTGKVTAENTDWDLRTIAADNRERLYEHTIPATVTRKLTDGDYEVVLRVVHPLQAVYPNTLPFRFANETQGNDGWLVLGSIRVLAGPK